MFIYKLNVCGFESHYSYLKKFLNIPGFLAKGQGEGDSLWRIWFLILVGTVFYWTKRFNLNKFFQRNTDFASETTDEIFFKKFLSKIFLICSSQLKEGQEGWAWRKVMHLFFWCVGVGDMTEWWEVSKIWVCALLHPIPFLVVNSVPIY